MLSSSMIFAQHARWFLRSSALTCPPSNASTYSHPKLSPFISFADPHPLTSLESYRFKNSGQGGLLSIAHLVSPLTATLTYPPVDVANKRLTRPLNPLDATFTKNRGWGHPNEDPRPVATFALFRYGNAINHRRSIIRHQ